jgi:ribosomal protein S18 acetylase RimI-like enzyme
MLLESAGAGGREQVFVRCLDMGGRYANGDASRYNGSMTAVAARSIGRGWRLADNCAGVDWAQARADLKSDDFDNGRSPDSLRLSFEQSQYLAFAWVESRVVGMARLLSDGVCNAYLLDVWTHSAHRRRGIGAAMVRHLIAAVPGQHVGWQTDDAVEFYSSLGAQKQPEFMSMVSGNWLDNDANR